MNEYAGKTSMRSKQNINNFTFVICRKHINFSLNEETMDLSRVLLAVVKMGNFINIFVAFLENLNFKMAI